MFKRAIYPLFILLSISAAPAHAEDVAPGLSLMLDANKGNCLACHTLAGQTPAGNIGPQLENMASKFREVKALQSYIWNASATKPNTIMPPYGKHQILTDDEIEAISEYLFKM